MADLVANSGNGVKAHEPDGSEPMIVFENVSIGFSDRPVLEDVSYHVGKGQTLCILGRSGVGKSVSLRILMGFLKPDAGSVRVEGQEITTLTEAEMNVLRRRITMVFQNGALFDSLTVKENVAFPLREQGGLEEDQILQVVDRLLDLVGAADVEGLLPASLSTGGGGLWRLRGRWRRNQTLCCTTSRQRWSIR